MESDKYVHLERRYGNMKTFFDADGFEAINSLSPEEKEFAYYMSMVAICSYPITLFQLCPHPEIHHKIANYLLNHPDADNELKIYWLYLFSNYGVHCVKESENNKKIPKDLGLSLNAETFKQLGINLTAEEELYLFDKSYFPTATVSESIEQSGSHFYGKGMTTEHYNTLIKGEKNKLNGYYSLEDGEVKSQTYAINGVCSEYMINCAYWLKRAREVARNNPKYFDLHTVTSLEYLVKYYRKGDENDFKSHCVEWLKMRNSKVEYTTGFIEYYDDPLSKIGTHQSDVTIKSLDITNLLKLLPVFEEKFSFPREWKRTDMTIIPNAAAAHKIMGMGGLGPILCTIAYCLPNYDDMRSELGSKQVMYTLPQGGNIDLYKQIYLSVSEREFFDTYSPDMKLSTVMDSLCTTLHETIGHASGNTLPDPDGKSKSDRIGCWTNGLEEMRAEILALYTGTHFLFEIANSGVLGDWYSNVPEEKLLELQVQHIAGGGISRWRSTPVDTTEVSQAHALADTGILYYLIDHSNGALELKEDTIRVNDTDLSVLRLVIHNVYLVLPIIEELAIKVQELSSNAIFEDIDAFMKKYAVSTRNSKYSSIVKQMRETCSQGVLMSIQIFPQWIGGEFSVPIDPIQSTLNIWKLATQ